MASFPVIFVIVLVGLLQVNSKEQQGKTPSMEDVSRFLEKIQPDGLVENLSKIVGSGVVSALGLGSTKRSDGSTASESWVPSLFKTMKYAFNYLGKSKEFGIGGSPHGDNGLTGVVCLLALVAIAAFLLIFLQPMLFHPHKRRMSRRFRGNPSPYAYKSPTTYWTSEGKHFSSSETRPIIVPGPALVPVAMPLTAPIPTTIEDSEGQQTQLPQKQVVRRRRVRKNQQKAFSGKVLSGAPGVDFLGQPNDAEDKLTKDEILYILKTLDD